MTDIIWITGGDSGFAGPFPATVPDASSPINGQPSYSVSDGSDSFTFSYNGANWEFGLDGSASYQGGATVDSHYVSTGGGPGFDVVLLGATTLDTLAIRLLYNNNIIEQSLTALTTAVAAIPTADVATIVADALISVGLLIGNAVKTEDFFGSIGTGGTVTTTVSGTFPTVSNIFDAIWPSGFAPVTNSDGTVNATHAADAAGFDVNTKLLGDPDATIGNDGAGHAVININPNQTFSGVKVVNLLENIYAVLCGANPPTYSGSTVTWVYHLGSTVKLTRVQTIDAKNRVLGEAATFSNQL